MGCAAALTRDTLVAQTARSLRFAAAAQQIVGKPTPTACGQHQKLRGQASLQQRPRIFAGSVSIAALRLQAPAPHADNV
jgi:hypothetical protein